MLWVSKSTISNGTSFLPRGANPHLLHLSRAFARYAIIVINQFMILVFSLLLSPPSSPLQPLARSTAVNLQERMQTQRKSTNQRSSTSSKDSILTNHTRTLARALAKNYMLILDRMDILSRLIRDIRGQREKRQLGY